MIVAIYSYILLVLPNHTAPSNPGASSDPVYSSIDTPDDGWLILCCGKFNAGTCCLSSVIVYFGTIVL